MHVFTCCVPSHLSCLCIHMDASSTNTHTVVHVVGKGIQHYFLSPRRPANPKVFTRGPVVDAFEGPPPLPKAMPRPKTVPPRPKADPRFKECPWRKGRDDDDLREQLAQLMQRVTEHGQKQQSQNQQEQQQEKERALQEQEREFFQQQQEDMQRVWQLHQQQQQELEQQQLHE